MNASQSYHGQFGAVDGNLTHTFISQVTVSEADLLNRGAAVCNCLGYVIIDLLEACHGDGLQVRATGHYGLNQSWGELCEERGQTMRDRQMRGSICNSALTQRERGRERER